MKRKETEFCRPNGWQDDLTQKNSVSTEIERQNSLECGGNCASFHLQFISLYVKFLMTMKKIFQTQKQQIRGLTKAQYTTLRQMGRLSKNLYNVALYSTRQYFFAEQKFLRYEPSYHAVKENENYKALHTDFAQQTIKVVARAFHSFLGLLRKAQKGEYRYQDVRIPKYLNKDGFFALITSRISVKNGNQWKIPMSRAFKKEHGEIEITLPSNLDPSTIKEVRIHPRYDARFFEIEYVYEYTTQQSNLNPQKGLSIDLGLDNLATFVDTDGASEIIDGRYLKSINHHYNKRIVHLNSIRAHQGSDAYTHLQCQLTIQRDNRIRDYMNKAARYIVNHCLDNQIGTLVVGYNPDWKRNLNIGRVNNQNFVSIPHGQLRMKLSNLCARYGIRYVEQEESYTSKASFPDNDTIPKWTGEHKDHPFSGQRIHLGLYRTKDGTVINADANSAANNLRKSKQKVDFNQLCTGRLASPLRKRLR